MSPCPENAPGRLFSRRSEAFDAPQQQQSSDMANFQLSPLDKAKLLYHINKMIGTLHLCIPLLVTPDILQIAHGESYPGSSYCYKIVARS